MKNTIKVTLDGRIKFEGDKCFFVVNPHEDYNAQYRILLGYSHSSCVSSMNDFYDYRTLHCLKSTFLKKGEIPADITFLPTDIHTTELNSRYLKSKEYLIHIINTKQISIWDIS